ncbi:MAG: hypothetical protein OXF02_07270 [Simkaniaceae bacterium]|nr:hypothetical protein [Simkaniaceae bacterium]
MSSTVGGVRGVVWLKSEEETAERPDRNMREPGRTEQATPADYAPKQEWATDCDVGGTGQVWKVAVLPKRKMRAPAGARWSMAIEWLNEVAERRGGNMRRPDRTGRATRGGNMRRPGRTGRAIWLEKEPGGPPLRFYPVPKGVSRNYTKKERGALIDYALEMRGRKSVAECAGKCGAGRSTLEGWIRTECTTHPVIVALGGRTLLQQLRRIDYRALLVDLRIGKDPILISDYSVGKKYRGRKRIVDVRANE